ncbi:acyltransferase [Pseudoalteromonas aurantia]|uniref:Maltose acetyltransferase n=1 Tax=Pseudoalteromonas aurantia TaxID=43654 RepID=A0A5S3V9H8_9GAMM|nr:acyltransferase [Pseudoalteromonas aurantia]TMO64184.1 maltose acetyltransferase [Pseudoalteromonas aurantia]TMO68536.1 maltose acetyltransferase [Pseudoalteromonas aurantia]TMO75174.1 maltose acetyltransferase [Pseudoalteromonas aurantia]
MFRYKNNIILCPTQDLSLSDAMLKKTINNKLNLGRGALIKGCPRVYITSIYNEASPSYQFSKEEIKNSIIIGENCFMDSTQAAAFPNPPVKLSCNKLVSRPLGKINIGNNCTLQGTSICSYDSVEIGDNVMFGPNVVIMDSSGHALTDRGADNEEQRIKISPVTVGDDVWVGYGCIILPGVTIGRGAVVGAGSVVTKNVPPLTVVAGNPCQIVKRLSHR